MKTRSTAGIEDLSKSLNQWLRYEQYKTSRTLMMRVRAARVLKASCSNGRASSQCTTCLWETKWWLLKSQHGRWGVRSSHACHNLVCSRHGLESQNYNLKLTVNDGHTWSPLSHCDLELAIKDCHAWSQVTWLRPRVDSERLSCLAPLRSSWHRVGRQRWPCLVLDDAAMTSIWLSTIVMLGPH